MKLAVIGETRMPVLPRGAGELGRTTHMLATALDVRGHDVTLFAPAGSEWGGKLLPPEALDITHYVAVLDCTHHHHLSREWPDGPVENLILDRECGYTPPCAVVETLYMRQFYRTARLAPAGIDPDLIPFCEHPTADYLVFMGARVDHKRPQLAQNVADRAGMLLRWICPPNDLSEAQKWDILGNALAMLAPYSIDAGPRAPLEAAACGTPTICLDGDGTMEHIKWCMSGFNCISPDEMVEYVSLAHNLDRKLARDWVVKTHNIHDTIQEHESILQRIADGWERW